MKIRNKTLKALDFRIGAEATQALAQLAEAAKAAAQATTASFSTMSKLNPPDKKKSSASKEYLSGFEAATKKLQAETKKPLLFMQPKLVKADPAPVHDYDDYDYEKKEFKAAPVPKKKPTLPEAKPAPVTAKRKIILED